MAFFKFNHLPLVPLLLFFLAASEFVPHADAATYVVGDAMNWTVPQGGADAYASWASAHTFRVGDILVFRFTTGEHDVARVNQGAYDRCSSDGALALITIGPADITLNSTGPDYFICTFGQHCSFGQKLAINVSAATSPPSPSPRPSTPGAPPTMPPSTTPVAPTMPPSTTPVAPTVPPSTTPVAPTIPPSLPPSIASPPTSPPTMGPSGGSATPPSSGGSVGGPPTPGPTSGPGGGGAGAGGGASPPSSDTTTTMTSGSVIALVFISIIFHGALVM